MPTVLVIDDRADVRRALEAILRARGYASRSACGGESGLAALRETDFDAVVVDIFMPDLDGIATIQAMRREFPFVSIIAISGHPIVTQSEGKPDFLKMAVKFGAEAALRKPFSPAQLIEALSAAIGSRQNRSLPTKSPMESSFPSYDNSTAP